MGDIKDDAPALERGAVTACGECNNLGEMAAESGVLYRRFLRPSHLR